jgi:hypothetical protein
MVSGILKSLVDYLSLGDNCPIKTILMAKEAISSGRKVILLANKVISLVSKIISLGTKTVSLANKTIFLGREIVSLANKIVLLGRKMAFLPISMTEKALFFIKMAVFGRF